MNSTKSFMPRSNYEKVASSGEEISGMLERRPSRCG
jgi:hypothetical protein